MKALGKLLCAGVLTLLSVSSAHGGGDELLVIVHPEVGSENLSRGDLRPIFQTTKISWGGVKMTPLNLPSVDSSRKGFDAAVLGLDPDRVARYWIDRKIRGGNPPPKSLPNPAVVTKIVATKKGAIGYVPAGTETKGVKVVARVRAGDVLSP
jgi:hypothetical protein